MSSGCITFTTLTSVEYGAKHERRTKQEEVNLHNTLLNHVNEGKYNKNLPTNVVTCSSYCGASRYSLLRLLVVINIILYGLGKVYSCATVIRGLKGYFI